MDFYSLIHSSNLQWFCQLWPQALARNWRDRALGNESHVWAGTLGNSRQCARIILSPRSRQVTFSSWINPCPHLSLFLGLFIDDHVDRHSFLLHHQLSEVDREAKRVIESPRNVTCIGQTTTTEWGRPGSQTCRRVSTQRHLDRTQTTTTEWGRPGNQTCRRVSTQRHLDRTDNNNWMNTTGTWGQDT